MRMLKHNLGYPRMGAQRQLKKACEQYWQGRISRPELFAAAKRLQEEHWAIQQQAGMDLIPCNDFSFYDQVLDMTLLLGAIPDRYAPVVTEVPETCILPWHAVIRKTGWISQPWK
jgi:5-methyltetrahydropteroyltriglutamate--homocysteine methyltransferase